ncbi:MAG: extracellular solute-binding protein, partial [Ruthenibacterium sp.]
MFKQAKKAVSLVLTVALAAMLAVGCGKAAPVTDAAGESAVSAGANGRTKVVMAVWSSGAADVFKKAQDAFNASQDEIQFEIQMQSGDYSDYLGAKVAANDLPDMYFLTPYKQVQSFADAGRLLDLSDCTFNDKIFNSAKGAVSYEGKTYAYPMNMEFLGVYYNQKLFEQAGIEK